MTSDDAASESTGSEASNDAFYDVDDADSASFVSARSSATMHSAASSSSSSRMPDKLVPGQAQNTGVLPGLC